MSRVSGKIGRQDKSLLPLSERGILEAGINKKKYQGLVTRQFVKDTVENALDKFAQMTERAFQKTATKEDLKEFATKDDLRGFATKDDVKAVRQEMATKKDLQEMENRIKSYFENRDAEIQGAHEDELDIVAGKKPASLVWKSVPRRLKAAEVQIEKIKDHINLP